MLCAGPMRPTAIISINSSWNVINFRSGIVDALRVAGWRIVVLTPSDEWSSRLEEIGAEHVAVAMDSRGLSPRQDLALLFRYRRELKRLNPQIFLGYTAKPNIWGSLAAHSLGIPVINNVSGLGTAFLASGILQRIVMMLYRVALRGSRVVFFQNADDKELFLASGLVRSEQARLLPGSGIDVDYFDPASFPLRAIGPFTFLFVGRLIGQKGIYEFVEAARMVRREMPDVQFKVLGFLDAENRSAVTREEVTAWQREGSIEYLGSAEDVRPYIADADCVVLPSWREGLPRTLLEGAAMARPLIATAVPGCRQVVSHEVNGLLCAPRNPASLAQAMVQMLGLSDYERAAMGDAGRLRVKQDFTESAVVGSYLSAIEEAFTRR